MKLILSLFILTTSFAHAGEVTTKAQCAGGGLTAEVDMDEIGDNSFIISQKGKKKADYENNSSDPQNTKPSTVTAVLDENAGVLVAVGLNISDNNYTLQETTLVSVPKTYSHKPDNNGAPGDATFNANLTGPLTNNLNLLMKCSLRSEI